MILNILDKIVSVVDKVITGNFELTRDEIEKRIEKLQARRRRINDELERAHAKMYRKGWVSPERMKEDL